MLKLKMEEGDNSVKAFLKGFITSKKLHFSHWIDLVGYGNNEYEAKQDLDNKINYCMDELQKVKEEQLSKGTRTVMGRCKECREELIKLLDKVING